MCVCVCACVMYCFCNLDKMHSRYWVMIQQINRLKLYQVWNDYKTEDIPDLNLIHLVIHIYKPSHCLQTKQLIILLRHYLNMTHQTIYPANHHLIINWKFNTINPLAGFWITGDTHYWWHPLPVTPNTGDTHYGWRPLPVTPITGDTQYRWHPLSVTPIIGDTNYRWH